MLMMAICSVEINKQTEKITLLQGGQILYRSQRCVTRPHVRSPRATGMCSRFIWCQVPGTSCQVLGARHLDLVPGTGTWHLCLVPGTWFLVPGTRYLVPGTWNQIHGTWCLVPIPVTRPTRIHMEHTYIYLVFLRGSPPPDPLLSRPGGLHMYPRHCNELA